MVHFFTKWRVVHNGAMRQVEKAGTFLRHGFYLGKRRTCWHHGIEEWKCQRNAATSQDFSTRQVFLG